MGKAGNRGNGGFGVNNAGFGSGFTIPPTAAGLKTET
jgi:hypothetical protein